MNKKKIIIILVVAALLLLTALLVIRRNNPDVFRDKEKEKVFIPEFLSSSEKQSWGIAEETRIQVINRNENGEVSVYRVIESDDQVVNPEEMGPVSPRTQPME